MIKPGLARQLQLHFSYFVSLSGLYFIDDFQFIKSYPIFLVGHYMDKGTKALSHFLT
jgi:hypothetical protein